MTTLATFLWRAFIDVAHMAALAVDLGMLQREWKIRFFPMKDLQRLLGHALVARLRVTIQTLIVGILPSMRLLMLMTTHASDSFDIELFELRTTLATMTATTSNSLMLSGQSKLRVCLVVENVPFFPSTWLMASPTQRRSTPPLCKLSKASFMMIVCSMAALAGRLWFLLAKRWGMATHTLCLAVFSHKRKPCLTFVSKMYSAQRALFGRVAELTLLGCKEVSIMWAGVTRIACVAAFTEFKLGLGMALRTGYVGMCTL